MYRDDRAVGGCPPGVAGIEQPTPRRARATKAHLKTPGSLPAQRDPEIGLDKCRQKLWPEPRTVATEADDLVLRDVERTLRAAVPAGPETQSVVPRGYSYLDCLLGGDRPHHDAV